MHAVLAHDGTDGVLTGTAFTDGSLRHKHRTAGQAGWAALEWGAGRSGARVVYYGALPVSLPVHRRILRAELWALLQVLVSCLPPIAVFVDNSTVVRGICEGKVCFCCSSRPHADIWRRIWHYIDDIGLGSIG